MIFITWRDSTNSIACRLCELSPGYPETSYLSSTKFDDMDMDQLIKILTEEHGFDRDKDCLAWENRAPAFRSIIGNQRQLLGVICGKLFKSERLEFFIVPHQPFLRL